MNKEEPMKCKKCQNEFSPEKGLKNYCSLTCRNSRSWTEIDKKKKSISAINSDKVKLANACRKKPTVGADEEPIKYSAIADKIKQTWNKKLLEADFTTLKFERLRKRIILEQNEKCNVCGISDWRSLPISLEIDHKNGDNQDNRRENLEALCPNCHSQTKTWRGRNKNPGHNQKRVSDEELYLSLVSNNWNIRQALLGVGLSAKGGNYKRCYKLKRLTDGLEALR